MNFFKLYIGDYQRDTAHLSVTEHGAYLLMLQHYYATEKPLPTGKALHRMLRVQDKSERDAVDAIVAQFWIETPTGLINERADVEITKADAQANTNARIAQEREARRKAQRESNEPSTNRATNDQPNHNQTPDTNTSPSLRSGEGTPKRATRAKRSEITLQAYIDLCRAEGKKPIPPDHPIREYCRDAGITDEMVQVAWLVFRDKYLTGEHATKGYKDWPGHFANNIKNRWQNLWFVNSEGAAEWTATGQQARRVVETRAKTKQELTHEPA